MRGALAARWWGVVGAGVALLLAAPSQALEFFDGRLNVSGFYEMQIRGLANDFRGDDGYDLAAMDNVLNIETEAEIAPYGWGPFNMVTGFARIEVRYNCVYNHACGIFPSVNAYGNDAQRLPKRLLNGRRSGFTGELFTNDGGAREYRRINLGGGDLTGVDDDERRVFRDFDDPARPSGASFSEKGLFNDFQPASSRRPLRIEEIPPFGALAGTAGPDGFINTEDDPFLPLLREFQDCRFGIEDSKGPSGGVAADVLPHSFNCPIDSTAVFADVANPFRAGDFNPRTGSGGSTELPLRPAPVRANTDQVRASQAQGLWLPNPALADRVDQFDTFDQNFREEELQWNRGAAQQDEKELREAYLDLEMFDSRLFLRLGKQNIVWGKTELFRTTDQFNPQDIALATLPSLEESRIPLWAARGIWSFYEVGPFQDVRLELAANLDQFEPQDLGRCGEPFVPRAACDLTFGLFAHGIFQNGLAGMERPEDPWNSTRGLEVGARLEWRWDRFSFALIDFYGYSDSFHLDRLFTFSRNVDPSSGRPLVAGADDGCDTGTEANCLFDPTLSAADQRERSVTRHAVNQQSFAVICSTSIGFSSLDPTVCAQSVFNSQFTPSGALGFTLADIFGVILSGENTFNTSDVFFNTLMQQLSGGTALDAAAVNAARVDGVARGTPLVEPSMDPNDPDPTENPAPGAVLTLGDFLTPEQEALLGCGPFYGTICNGLPAAFGGPGSDGIDLLNASASAIMQSFPGAPGSLQAARAAGVDPRNFTTTNAAIAQPGTVNFPGQQAVCAIAGTNGRKLPGCRGPGDAGFSVAVDGDPTGGDNGGIHPFTGQAWDNEMAIVSWNLLMALSAFSAGDPADRGSDRDGDGVVDRDVFDPARPFRENGCSFAKPQLCSSVQALFTVTGMQRSVVEASGNNRFGRLDFTWHGGGNAVAKFEKRNVLGFSMDFAEDATKSNWSIEATWIEDIHETNNDSFDGLEEVDQYNLTVSVDRPTFVSFLNANRTFFINSQWFFQYTSNWDDGFTGNGPFNAFFTFTVQTGYFQDRLLPSLTTVFDFGSSSGALLPQVQYRFTERFSATFGVNAFFGQLERKDAAVNPLALPNRVGGYGDNAFVENGLSPVREKDEVFARIRYTF